MYKRQSKLLMVLIFIAVFVIALIIEYHPPQKRLRTPSVKSAVKSPAKTPAAKDSGKLDINTATKAELIKLHGIGQKLAERIIEYREKCGGFEAIEELSIIPGISEKTVDKLRDRICVR